MTTAIEPAGGWPAELAEGSGKIWDIHFMGRSIYTLTHAEVRTVWRMIAIGDEDAAVLSLFEHKGIRWDRATAILKRHGLIKFNRETRRWEALRVPA